MKRILNVLLLVGILCAAFYTLYEMSEREIPLSDPWKSIPSSSAVLVEFPDPSAAWSKLANRSQVWQSLRHHPNVERIHRLFSKAFDAPIDDAAIQPFCRRPMLLSLSRNGDGDMAMLMVLAAEKAVGTEQLLDLLACVDPTIIERADQTADDSYVLELDSSIGNIHVRYVNDLLLIATDKELLTRSPDDSLFIDQTGVEALRKTLGKGADAHVLMNTDLVEGFLDVFIHPEQQRQLKLPPGYAALDLAFSTQVMLMSGVILPSEQSTLKEFGQSGGPNRPQTMVPYGVSYIYNIHVEDVQSFTEQFLVPGSDEESIVKEFRDSLAIDMQEFFASWLNGELLIALEDENPSLKWVCARALDRITAKDSFDRLRDAVMQQGHDVALEEDGDLISYHFPQPLPLSIFGPAFNKINPTYVGLMKDVVVFASSENSLRRALSSLAMDRTLANDERAMAQFNDLPDEHRLLIWCDLARSKELASYYVNVDRAEGDTSSLDALGTLSLTIGRTKDQLTHISMSLQHAPIQEEARSNVIWRADLASRVKRKPDILDDHTSPGKNVLVQDEDNTVYFFSSAGELLWKRNPGKPIIGEVHQVDRYRNGKLQMLLNTEDKIYLIDRNGNDVDGFPVEIKNSTSAPLALIDYDNDRNYRILIPDLKGGIHNFELSGKRVDGWDPIKLASRSSRSIKHLRIKSKDYLMVVDDAGKPYLLDRRGKTRYKASLTLNGIRSHGLQTKSALQIGKTIVHWTDTLGQLWKGELAGSAELINPGEWNDPDCVIEDLDEDGVLDLIRYDADSVAVYCSSTGKYTIHQEDRITGSPNVFNFGKGKKRVGFSTDAPKGVMLYDIFGEPVLEEALEGNSTFSISDLNADGKLEIVTTNLVNELVVLHLP